MPNTRNFGFSVQENEIRKRFDGQFESLIFFFPCNSNSNKVVSFFFPFEFEKKLVVTGENNRSNDFDTLRRLLKFMMIDFIKSVHFFSQIFEALNSISCAIIKRLIFRIVV